MDAAGSYLVNTVVTEVDMEAYFVDLVQGLAPDLDPFCSHAYEILVAVAPDSYLVPPYYCQFVLAAVADVAELSLVMNRMAAECLLVGRQSFVTLNLILIPNLKAAAVVHLVAVADVIVVYAVAFDDDDDDVVVAAYSLNYCYY